MGITTLQAILGKGLIADTDGSGSIQLDPDRKLVVKEAAGGINTWSDARFEASSLAGQSSSVVEGGAKTFTVYLNQAAQAGETLTLSLGALGDKFQVMITPPGAGVPTVVSAQSAIITLAAGQTQASFALLQTGEVSADASAQLSVSYQPATDPAGGPGSGAAVQSNAWAINLQDAGAVGQTSNGDQRAEIIGTEIDLGTPVNNSRYGTYKWEATSWGADGTLIGGVAAPGFSDVIRGTAGNDKINGLLGNDALDGGAGNDMIEGGAGDDLIGGGAGSDTILGGAGNDYINSSATLNVSLRSKPSDRWRSPSGQQVLTQGAVWGIYLDTEADGDPVTVWSGSNDPSGTDADVVDAGDGDDQVDGGAGDDYLEGGGKDDRLYGGDGKDNLWGNTDAANVDTLAANAAYWGNDFLEDRLCRGLFRQRRCSPAISHRAVIAKCAKSSVEHAA